MMKQRSRVRSEPLFPLFFCYEISSYARKACWQNSCEADKQGKIRMVGHWYATGAYQLNSDEAKKQGKI
jgi:hypothetical protein